MFSNAVGYESLIEEYDAEEAEEIWNSLEDNGYHVEGNEAYRKPDLSGDPGISVPYTDHEIKMAGNVSEGVAMALDTVFPDDWVKLLHPGLLREEVDEEVHKINALSHQDYRNLKEVEEEVPEP